MAKGYWIGRIDVDDPEGYKDYVATAKPAYGEYGAVFLVRGGDYEAVEGTARGRNVVVEFPSYEAALACYNSETYQKARAIRQKHARGEIIIVKGAD
ncbi:DUF1330 domain-containing protein [Pseudohoeflea coraliihabitans]|uniref:DUF1330 domain-containing protein n=1 Tax=Pseudohoeflea coraliihabitans TaxID=2860393 RepID=A0ABS6WSY5_9HYPH|nr:DUF1330 domain-containing protein [Pseudohoeflea sp. DP4N28-3]MBW3099073.1 DUF1330 domain-containing protein [Pseudohoeflea sp. DP4N28-3]